MESDQAEPEADHSYESAHGHSHGHGHAHDIEWSAFGSMPMLRAVLGFVILAAVATAFALVALWPTGAGAEQAREGADQIGFGAERLQAAVTDVADGPCSYSTADNPHECRVITFVVQEGAQTGARITLAEFNLRFDAATPDVEPGDDIIAGYEPSTDAWYYADLDRRPPLLTLGLLFAIVVIALGRWRGVMALAGMTMTVVVLIGFVAPSVLDGHNPVLVSVVAAGLIAFISLYLTHGFNPTTTVALAGTLGALGLTLAVSGLFFRLARFSGLATEEALLLPFIAGDINVSALLLGGAMLGTLGALDDVTVTQVATVAEIGMRRPDLGAGELIASGIRVGREHIASTVNTLLLAYAGASMPLLLLFAAAETPWGLVANSEIIATEIVRTLCGSIGLVAAVPITTALAALVTAGPGPSAADDDAADAADAADDADSDGAGGPGDRDESDGMAGLRATDDRDGGDGDDDEPEPAEATPTAETASWSDFSPEPEAGW